MLNTNQNCFETNVIIPGYDSKNNGLVVQLKLTAYLNQVFSIRTVGSVATALEKNFARVTNIMASLKKNWEHLGSMQYTLQSFDNKFCVRDARSSSMALCIGVLNINNQIDGRAQNFKLVGTGILRIDGSFEKTCFENKKKLAVKNDNKFGKKFVSAINCEHVFDLDTLMRNYT